MVIPRENIPPREFCVYSKPRCRCHVRAGAPLCLRLTSSPQQIAPTEAEGAKAAAATVTAADGLPDLGRRYLDFLAQALERSREAAVAKAMAPPPPSGGGLRPGHAFIDVSVSITAKREKQIATVGRGGGCGGGRGSESGTPSFFLRHFDLQDQPPHETEPCSTPFAWPPPRGRRRLVLSRSSRARSLLVALPAPPMPKLDRSPPHTYTHTSMPSRLTTRWF